MENDPTLEHLDSLIEAHFLGMKKARDRGPIKELAAWVDNVLANPGTELREQDKDRLELLRSEIDELVSDAVNLIDYTRKRAIYLDPIS